MGIFSWIVNIIVIVGMAYLTFAMALAGWFAGLRRGEAVTLLPEQGSRTKNLWAQAGIVVVSLVLSAAVIYVLWIPVPHNLSTQAASVLRIIGLVLFVLGTFVVAWARQTLGRMWGLSTTREVRLLSNHQLVKAGPYAVVRHPMYSAWWLALLGAILIYWTWILILMLVFSAIVFSRRARLEEKVLAERFGAEWEVYIRSTKSLIPFIY